MFKITTNLKHDMLAGARTALNGGSVYIFSGAIPAEPGDALDIVAVHTQLARLTESDDDTTGLTFAVPANGLMAKTAAEDWLGTVAFDGFEDAQTTLTPTFFRFCATGDNGRGASANPRLQGTVGGPASIADMKLGSNTLTDNGSNTTSSAIFIFAVGSTS